VPTNYVAGAISVWKVVDLSHRRGKLAEKYSFCAAVSAASNQASVAIARLGTISGSAILIAPLVLGLFTGNAGIHAAFGIV
jgi:hypothetical protein